MKTFFLNSVPITVKDLNEIDPDDLCDDALGSDIEGSETDSKMSDSKRNGDGKSQGNSSKPRRWDATVNFKSNDLKYIFYLCSIKQSSDSFHLWAISFPGEQIQDNSILVSLRTVELSIESQSYRDAGENMVKPSENFFPCSSTNIKCFL